MSRSKSNTAKTTIIELISAITSVLPSMGDMVSASIGPVMVIGIAMFLLRLWNEKDRAQGKSDEYPENDTENDTGNNTENYKKN